MHSLFQRKTRHKHFFGHGDNFATGFGDPIVLPPRTYLQCRVFIGALGLDLENSNRQDKSLQVIINFLLVLDIKPQRQICHVRDRALHNLSTFCITHETVVIVDRMVKVRGFGYFTTEVALQHQSQR